MTRLLLVALVAVLAAAGGGFVPGATATMGQARQQERCLSLWWVQVTGPGWWSRE